MLQMRSLVKGGVVSVCDFEHKVQPLLAALRTGTLQLDEYALHLSELFDFGCWRDLASFRESALLTGCQFFDRKRFLDAEDVEDEKDPQVELPVVAGAHAVGATTERSLGRPWRPCSRRLLRRPVSLICNPDEADFDEVCQDLARFPWPSSFTVVELASKRKLWGTVRAESSQNQTHGGSSKRRILPPTRLPAPLSRFAEDDVRLSRRAAAREARRCELQRQRRRKLEATKRARKRKVRAVPDALVALLATVRKGAARSHDLLLAHLSKRRAELPLLAALSPQAAYKGPAVPKGVCVRFRQPAVLLPLSRLAVEGSWVQPPPLGRDWSLNRPLADRCRKHGKSRLLAGGPSFKTRGGRGRCRKPAKVPVFTGRRLYHS